MSQTERPLRAVSESDAKVHTVEPVQRPEPPPKLKQSLAVCAAVLVVLCGGLAFTSSLQLGAIDDAYISLRYATHWAAGEGLVFNLGERVEGYTNFLWIVLEATLIRAGIDPEPAMLILGWLSLLLITATFTWFLMSEPLNLDPKWAMTYGVLLCMNPIMLCWAVSGMETIFYAWLLFLSALLLLKTHRTATRLSVISLVLAAMTRPEAAVMAPLFAALVWFKHDSLRRGITYALIFAVGYGTYFTWRVLHFELFLPNTFYAKLDYSSMLLMKRGLLYVWDFAVAVPLLVLLAAWSVRYRAGHRSHIVSFLAIILLHTAIVVYEGGDHFAMYRFLAPMIPFAGALALQYAAHRRRLSAHAVCVLVFACTSLTSILPAKRYEESYSQLARFSLESQLAREWQEMGEWFKQHVPARTSLCTVAIGAVGFHSELEIIDPHGLIDPHIGTRNTRLGEGYGGHEKYDVEYTLGRVPDLIMLFNRPSEKPLRAVDQSGALWGDFNNQVFQRLQLHQDYQFESHDMGMGYINFYAHKSLRKAEAAGGEPSRAGAADE